MKQHYQSKPISWGYGNLKENVVINLFVIKHENMSSVFNMHCCIDKNISIWRGEIFAKQYYQNVLNHVKWFQSL